MMYPKIPASPVLSYRLRNIRIIAFLALLLGSLTFIATAQDATATPVPASPPFRLVSQAWFPGVTIKGPFTEVVRVFEFEAGSGTGLHTHGGPTLLSMMDGALTLSQNDVETVYPAWSSWTEQPDVVHEAFNAGDTTARVIASYLVPEGGAPATPQGEASRPAGTKLVEAQFPGVEIEGLFTELLRVIDFPPGSTTGLHKHGGPTFLIMVEGALTLRQEGVETVYEAGESWMETPDVVHEAFNAGDTNARVIAVYLLPMAAPTTLVQQ